MTPFIPEDGTGLPDATSYISVEEADEYLGSDWASDQPTKETALMDATEYQDWRWGKTLRSYPLDVDQSLEIPRAFLYDRYGRQIEGVPLDWGKACALYAQSSIAGSLYPTTSSDTPKEIKSKRTTVSVITTEVEYVGAVASDAPLDFPQADKFCKQYTGLTGSRVIRA